MGEPVDFTAAGGTIGDGPAGEANAMNEKEDSKPPKPPGRSGKLDLPKVGEVVIKHEDLPTKAPDDKRIHPRRPLPPVPDKSPDESREDR